MTDTRIASASTTVLSGPEQAARTAAAAAERAGLDIIELDDVDRILQASDLFNAVWSAAPEDPLIHPNMLRALVHAGNYAFGGYQRGRMIGAIVGFLGRMDGSLQLHSHILGVSPEAQDRRVGFALKQHQRAWALGAGLTTVTWTFDPLVRRNAFFNLAKLGAGVRAYYLNFYGSMNDGINGGDESDRVLIEWRLEAPAAIAASEGQTREPDLAALRGDGAVAVLELADDERPLVHEGTGAILLAQIPEDIVRIRTRDRRVAKDWRMALRDVLGGAVEDGYAAAAMTRSGWYVLRANAAAE